MQNDDYSAQLSGLIFVVLEYFLKIDAFRILILKIHMKINYDLIAIMLFRPLTAMTFESRQIKL